MLFGLVFDADFVSDGSKIPINECLCDYFKDQGYVINYDDVLGDNEHVKDSDKNEEQHYPHQHNESDYDHEVDDSDSDHSAT